MERKEWLKYLSGLVILYILFRMILSHLMGAELEELLVGEGRFFLFIGGMVSGIAAIRVSRNGFMIGNMRVIRSEAPETYYFCLISLFVVSIGCLSFFNYLLWQQTGLFQEVCDHGAGWLEEIQEFFLERLWILKTWWANFY